ncbi:response regulator [candidate division CSSED10-310 bacterium]|uniref:Response regulator n=1 Tax=candidate division CSSED10-310 bacterium TaxID=2855610 RepID=A0ABV6YR09_UNCC1
MLVVDDNQSSRDILRTLLQSLDCEVTSVSSGDAALVKLTRDREILSYELVLIDWKMPGMDGLELSKRIRNDPRLTQLPVVIMVSTYELEQAKKQAPHLHINAFLTKPVYQTHLLHTIMTALGQEVDLPAGEKTAEDVKPHEQLREANVLLVEDNPINQQVATEILKSADMIVSVAENGLAAIEALKEEKFDVVLMDVQMPVMDGLEATRLIRENPSHVDLPIIAMTAQAMKGDREKCHNAGMNDYVTKPIDTVQLFTTLSRWVRSVTIRLKDSDGREEQKSAADEFPDNLPGIDVKEGLKRLADNRTVYQKILRDFSTEYENEVNKIKELLQSKDWSNAQRRAHTLKGVSGNIAASDLFTASSELEEALIQRDEKLIDHSIEHVRNALDKVLESIRKLKVVTTKESKEANNAEDDPVVDETAVIKIVSQLRILLKKNNPEAEACLISLQKQLGHDRYHNELKQLAANIQNYDFVSARKNLASLTELLNISL